MLRLCQLRGNVEAEQFVGFRLIADGFLIIAEKAHI
jgi:hypothetical protein